MLRLLVVGLSLWPAFAAKSAAFAGLDQPGVTIEADTGAPKPGEGEGGVAVLIKPLPEATTMKTWGFLKESMLKIGEQVKQILQVRQDMSALQKDLSDQETTWHNAEIELKQENGQLEVEIEKIKKEVREGAKVKQELLRARQLLEEEQRRAADLENNATQAERSFRIEVKFIEERRDNITRLHQEINETASKEISRAEAVALQLQKDAVTLRLAIAEFQDRLKNGKAEMDFENEKSLARQAELHRQLAAMQEGLKRIQGRLKPRHIFDQEEMSLKAQLQTATASILQLQGELQQIVTECSKEIQQSDDIKCSEENKLRNRIAEKTQLCNAVQVQNQVLKQDMQKCGLVTNIGVPPESPQPPTQPGGLVRIVPVRDLERTLPVASPFAAPAAAPSPYPESSW